MAKMKDKTHIPQKVRISVQNRDSYNDAWCCIYCGRTSALQLHHFVERSRGGMGIESNLVTLCFECHSKIHNGDQRIKDFCRLYLKLRYSHWSEKAQIYFKE